MVLFNNEKPKVYLDANVVYGYFLAKHKELRKKGKFVEPKVIEFLRRNKDKVTYYVSTITFGEIVRRLRTELLLEKDEAVELWNSFLEHLNPVEFEENEIDWKLINEIVLEVKIKKRLSNLIHFSVCKKNDLWFLTGDKEILDKCKRFYPKILGYIEFRKWAESLNKEKENNSYERERKVQNNDDSFGWKEAQRKDTNENNKQGRIREESHGNNEKGYRKREGWIGLLAFVPSFIIISLLSSTALAQIQSHPLSQLYPMDVNLNLTGVNTTNVSYIFFGNNSVDTYLYRSASGVLTLNSHLVASGGWVNGTDINTTNIYISDDLRLFRGAADRLDLASGDSFNLVSGSLLSGGLTVIDSSRNINGTWVNASSLNVTGVNNVSIDSPTFFIDTTNNRVGIGTASPGFKFTVASTDADGIQIAPTGTESSSDLYFYPAAASALNRNWLLSSYATSQGDFGFYQSNAAGGNPRSSGTARLYINQAGNVGIGTTIPQSLLQVNSTTANAYIQFPVNNTAIVSTDCDNQAEVGRSILMFNTTSSYVYTCSIEGGSTIGWRVLQTLGAG